MQNSWERAVQDVTTPEGHLLVARVANATMDKEIAQQGDPDYQAAMWAKELGDRVVDCLFPR